MDTASHSSELANADLLTAVTDLEGVTARIDHVQLGGHPMVVVVRTAGISQDADGETGDLPASPDPTCQLVIGDGTGDGLGFDWSVTATDGERFVA